MTKDKIDPDLIGIDVKHVAQLANLTLSDEELKKFEKQLDETLSYINNLNEIKTDEIEPTNQVTGLINITRNDESKPSLTQKEALSNTKSQHNGMFAVAQLIEE